MMFSGNNWINPSKRLVDRAIEKWNLQNLRADNTTVVTVMLDPPGSSLSSLNVFIFEIDKEPLVYMVCF